jgi:ATP-dependent DNA helicase RecQ
MTRESFFHRCLVLDLETDRQGRIRELGAVCGATRLREPGGKDLERSLRKLDELAAAADVVAGHNVFDHDLPVISASAPRLKLLRLPVVDTLYLSPLAFPENPYHRLVKDYKLVPESISDPTADSDLALALLRDEWDVFERLKSAEPGLCGIFRHCFEQDLKTDAVFFDALGIPPISAGEALAVCLAALRDRVCRSAVEGVLREYLSQPKLCLPLAFGVAWLRVAGSNSIVPRWVYRQFTAVRDLLVRLRAAPCYDASCVYCRQAHDPDTLLKRFFGFEAFRPAPATNDGQSLQKEIVRQGMGGSPLLAILPTGGGKSLCYQLPALARNYRLGTLTIVLSPLQALMKDQVDGLAARTGTPFAGALNGLLTPPERWETLRRIARGDIAILYVSPEQLRNRSFRETIATRDIGCWVFDEVHCLSKWGHDFRPDYLHAGRFIRELAKEQGVPIPPVAGFTATAKRDVIEEIREYFRRVLGQDLRVLEAGVSRENLCFSVHPVRATEKYERVHEILADRLPARDMGSAIVFRATRREAEDTAAYLKQKGWPVDAFHAGLKPPEKRRIQDDFIRGVSQVICATNAFGMGIDKDNVRLVIHGDIPGSLENYIQEAGRAGRDNLRAECVLLYDEEDSEKQFQLGAQSLLSRSDIAQILRGLRRARRGDNDEVILTASELLRDEDVQTSFDSEDRYADTKVRTAIAWLERAEFVERNENRTNVFQGRPLVSSMEEAKKRIAGLNLTPAARQLWEAVIFRFLHAEPDKGISADELAGLPEFHASQPTKAREASDARVPDSSRVMRVLHDMAQAGLINRDLLLTAFVRHKVANPSKTQLERVCALETAMLAKLQEEEPDPEGWMNLSLRRLNQDLRDGGADCTPDVLRSLLGSLSMDGRGLAGSEGSLHLRHLGMDQYRVKFQRDWKALLATADVRRRAAELALAAILKKIPEEEPASADRLVEFALADIVRAFKADSALAGRMRDPPAVAERALMYLHEQKVIILQQGLAVFRQAMTIRILPQGRGRRYTAGDYSPIEQHHHERVFQVHVMDEYARMGLEKVQRALALVVAYFTMRKDEFVARFFGHNRKLLEHATTAESYRRIVDGLKNPVQAAIVTEKPEANLLILAGPGSGKTRTVAHRCAYLLRVLRIPARSVLVLAFNRTAAVSIRKRLRDLVGPDAAGVTVQTYHGLAMRLTGTSLAAKAEKAADAPPVDFDALISDAVKLLRGETGWPGLEVDEMRERLLGGFRHILVDEYQDIDEPQYELVSAIAGRTLSDPDAKLSIMAVGDDDQNIYAFRGANVEFIRRFEADYGAKPRHLVENYRSTAHIIEAANALIERNRDRMKTGHPIRIDKARRDDPPGGVWTALDPVARGRVQILRVRDEAGQAGALVGEMRRLKSRNSDAEWTDFAVLARTWEELSPIRALCEEEGIPVCWSFPRDGFPPLHRFREIAALFDFLREHESELARAEDLQRDFAQRKGDAMGPWWDLAEDLLDEWAEESAGADLPVKHAVDFVYEAVAEYRQDRTLGRGVRLGTVHGAKGLEFRHVFITGGRWGSERDPAKQEEMRRLFYVGMTRAMETLTLVEQASSPHALLGAVDGDYALRRSPPESEALPADLLGRRYGIVGMMDLHMDYASWLPDAHPIHAALARLSSGSSLRLRANEGRIEVVDDREVCVARLSQAGQAKWEALLPNLDRVRAVAMVQRRREDVKAPEYAARCSVELWELPILEVVYRADGEGAAATASAEGRSTLGRGDAVG